MSKILAQLWSVHQSLASGREEEPSLTMKSRFCASVLHDSLWLWRERFGGQEGSAPPLPPPTFISASPPQTQPPSLHLMQSSGFASSPSPSAPQPGFNAPSTGTGQLQGHPESPRHTAHTTDQMASGFFANDQDLAQNEQDWMWHVGFPSLTQVDLDFHSTNYSLGFANQTQM